MCVCINMYAYIFYIYIYIYIYMLHIYKEGVEREEMELAVPDGTLTEAKNLYHNRFYIYSTSIFIYTYTYG